MTVQQFEMPSKPSYIVPGGIPVYFVEARNKAKRTVPGRINTFILHDTDGKDSRQELYDSTRKVSVHYLIGEYAGYEGPICIKYASERDDAVYGAGFGTVGGIPSNLNDTSVQFETEYVGMNEATIWATSCVVAHSMLNWYTIPGSPVLLPHWLVDKRKRDPRYSWTEMLARVYRQFESFKRAGS